MIVQIIKFESPLAEDKIMSIAQERSDSFRALPGLVQKYYVKLDEPNHYGGVYIWDSVDSMKSYRESDLAASIPQAYEVIGAPKVEILDALFQLRE